MDSSGIPALLVCEDEEAVGTWGNGHVFNSVFWNSDLPVILELQEIFLPLKCPGSAARLIFRAQLLSFLNNRVLLAE